MSTKSKKKAGKKKGAFYFANPANLSREVASMGYSLSPTRTLGLYAVYVIASIVVGYLFELNVIPIIIIAAAGFLFMPLEIYFSFKNRFEQQRFSDVSEYMEHFLYSFRASHKILRSLKEVELSFKKGPMYDAIIAAEDEMLNGHSGADVERRGLEKIEEKYRCDRLHAIHKFAIEVETLGGEFDKLIDLLLEDRSAWVDRTSAFQKDKKSQKFSIIVSTVVTVAVCLLMQKALPDSISLSSSMVVQVATTVLIIADLILYAVADAKMCTDWLETKSGMTDEDVKRCYAKIQDRDIEGEKKRGIMAAVMFFVVFMAAGAITKMSALYAVGVGAAIFAYVRPGMTYRSSKKALEREVSVKFPQWLMGVSLQLQSESVQVAIFNSIPTAPAVLKPELEKLRKSLNEKPESVEPYLDFMCDLNVSEIQSSMKMLYSLSAGTGGDPDKQITEIIRRNNMLLDKAEKKAEENEIGGLYGLSMAPQMTGGMALLVDMIMFFVIFMGSVGNI